MHKVLQGLEYEYYMSPDDEHIVVLVCRQNCCSTADERAVTEVNNLLLLCLQRELGVELKLVT